MSYCFVQELHAEIGRKDREIAAKDHELMRANQELQNKLEVSYNSIASAPTFRLRGKITFKDFIASLNFFITQCLQIKKDENCRLREELRKYKMQVILLYW